MKNPFFDNWEYEGCFTLYTISYVEINILFQIE